MVHFRLQQLPLSEHGYTGGDNNIPPSNEGETSMTSTFLYCRSLPGGENNFISFRGYYP